jgi:hypothetical protein
MKSLSANIRICGIIIHWTINHVNLKFDSSVSETCRLAYYCSFRGFVNDFLAEI